MLICYVLKILVYVLFLSHRPNNLKSLLLISVILLVSTNGKSVSAVQLGLGGLSIRYLIMQRKAIFYRHLMYSYDVLLRDVF